MFRSIYGKNFQIHKEFRMELSPGVNVIIGTSDEGKTAILRMINWIASNRPSGDAFKNWAAPKKESVCGEIELWDGKSIILEREDGKNVYTIYDNRTSEELRFSSIKTDVPTEVSELLNLAEYNIQNQHQPYFLLQDTPGMVAKKLNDLVGLSIIDTLFYKLKSEVRSTSAKITALTSDIASGREEAKEYENLDEIEKRIVQLEKVHEETAVIASSLLQISTKLSDIKNINKMREKLTPLVSLEFSVTQLLDKLSSFTNLQIEIDTIETFVSHHRQITEQLESEHLWLSLESAHKELSEKIATITSLSKQGEGLSAITEQLKRLQNTISIKTSTKRNWIQKYLDEIKKAGRCPTCDSEIDAKVLDQIEKSLL